VVARSAEIRRFEPRERSALGGLAARYRELEARALGA
jgi:hypothetical protein